MEIFYVYLLTSNQIPFYVGKGMKSEKYNRVDYYIKNWEKSKNRKLVNKINKLDKIFDIEIIFESKNEQECLNLEIELIQKIGKENLCNLTDGGEGISGYNHTEESKQKISIWRKGKKFSKEVCEKITQNKIGNQYKLKNISEGIIEKLYETKSINEISKELNLSFPTVKKYLVDKQIYVPFKNKKSDSEETKKLKSKAKKRSTFIEQFDLENNKINEFESIVQACIYLNKLKRGGDIVSCCKGKQKTAFGFIWKYKNN